MDRRGHIEAKLREALDTTHIEVIDESHLHAGHAGAAGGGGHFRAVIVSGRLEGLNTLARQRLVSSMGSQATQVRSHIFRPEPVTSRPPWRS